MNASRPVPHYSLRIRLTLIGFSLAFALLALLIISGHILESNQFGSAKPLSAGNTYVVNSTADLPDADVGDSGHLCVASNGKCTLRAAIMQANFTAGHQTITLPSGVYVLTRPGDEDFSVVGDLDIADDLTIQGAGSSTTIVDGNGNVTGDRVFQILSSAIDTSISGITIRSGKKVATFDEGGGLYWEGGGGYLHLNDVAFVSNTAYYGGGLYLNYSSSGGMVEMDNIDVHANTAPSAAGGGLVADFASSSLDEFHMRGSYIYSNTAFQGGGLYLYGTPALFSDFSTSIEDSEIYSNAATGHGAGIDNDSGNADNPLLLIDSHLHHNHSAGSAGAIENNGGLSILRSTLDTNIAATQGGGVYNNDNGRLEITQSTLSANTAQLGGGIFIESFIYTRTLASVVNSTISGNTASHEGAGLYANGGRAQFYNATIAINRIVVPTGNSYPAMGAGLLITPNFGTNAIITLTNTLIGDNSLQVGSNAPVPDDCYGRVRAQGYNLIETLAHCAFENPSIGDVTGQDPKLGPLHLNGGSTATQALLPGSPAIDAGRPTGCSDAAGAPLTTDQRGWRRPIGTHCDIGAFEYSPNADYLPLIRR